MALAISERGERFATELLARMADLDAMLAPVDARAWGSACLAEGWPVGFVAHHIGLGLARQARWIRRRLRSGRVHTFSWDVTNEMNAALARRIGLPAKDTVRGCVRERADGFVSLARSLTDEQLDMLVFVFGEHSRSTDWVLRRIALRHVDEHAASIKLALG